MAKFKDKCPVCGREYDNYDAAYRRWCSVACEVKAVIGDDEPEPGDDEVKP